MLTVASAILIFGSVVALGIMMLRWQFRKGEQLLDQWARQHGFEVIERTERTPPGAGPMNRYAANKQIVYAVRVRNESGRVRTATVRVGSPEMGVMSDEISVEWDP